MVVVRRLKLDRSCDYVIIRGGRTGQPAYRFPKPIGVNRRANSSKEFNAWNSEDVLKFTDPFFTITVKTSVSYALKDVELEIAPSEVEVFESDSQYDYPSFITY